MAGSVWLLVGKTSFTKTSLTSDHSRIPALAEGAVTFSADAEVYAITHLSARALGYRQPVWGS